MNETELFQWLSGLTPENQEIFCRRAAGFFSSRELAQIMKYLRNGHSLSAAHKKSGVLSRYIVDLTKLKERFGG